MKVTQAICFKCGEVKHGAFTTCKACNTRPTSEQELALSLGLTDHYLSKQDLDSIGTHIKNNESISFREDQEEMLIKEIRTLLQSPMGEMLINSKRPTVDAHNKKWWEFWKNK